MGISSEYRLEYMPLMIQKKQVEYRIAMIGWARLSLSFFYTLDVLYLYFTVPMTWDVFMYTMTVLKSLSSILIVSISLSSSYC